MSNISVMQLLVSKHKLFKFTSFKLPSIFNSYFTHTSSIHHYATRGFISDFAMPSTRTKIRQKSIKYQGPFVWNKLAYHLKLKNRHQSILLKTH